MSREWVAAVGRVLAGWTRQWFPPPSRARTRGSGVVLSGGRAVRPVGRYGWRCGWIRRPDSWVGF